MSCYAEGGGEITDKTEAFIATALKCCVEDVVGGNSVTLCPLVLVWVNGMESPAHQQVTTVMINRRGYGLV